jgi:ribose 5-phosphate isomerase A
LKSPESNLVAKRLAAARAAELVEDGMTIGLGSGSTAECFVRSVGERVASGLRVRGIASSLRTEAIAAEVGIQLVDLDRTIDLAVDGADAIERGTLNAVKGLGGALTREKLIALAARRFVLVGDRSKLVGQLAERRTTLPVPVEVLAFGWKLTAKRLEVLGSPVLREQYGRAVTTDNGNVIVDLFMPSLDQLDSLAAAIHAVPGVVEHGLFLHMAELAIVAEPDAVETLRVC